MKVGGKLMKSYLYNKKCMKNIKNKITEEWKNKITSFKIK